MFGKGKKAPSDNAKFIMGMGMKAGNLKAPLKKESVKKVSPVQRADSPRTKMGAAGKVA